MGHAVAMGEHVARRPGEVATATSVTFEAFFVAERDGLVRAVTLAIGDARLAAEAVDEAMARAWQRWAEVSGYDRPVGWVYRVAVNWARSAWRKLGRLLPTDRPPDTGHVDPDPPDPRLWEALGRLPAAQRDAVVLHHVLQWTNPEIAEAMQVPVGTVKARVHRGVAALREEMTA